MDKNQLMDNLAHYGYALMRPNVTKEPEEVLKDLLQQNDVRFLEGFPVVFANALKEKKELSWESLKWHPGKELSKKAEHRLAVLLVLTNGLFKLFGLNKQYGERALKLALACEGESELPAQLQKRFLNSEPVKVDDLELSTERLKNNFRNYVVQAPESEELKKKQHALELELLLSQVFTPRQKELLRKRVEGKTFTKTEREYFYRVVKKRLRTLASEELHQMARDLLLKS